MVTNDKSSSALSHLEVFCEIPERADMEKINVIKIIGLLQLQHNYCTCLFHLKMNVIKYYFISAILSYIATQRFLCSNNKAV